MKKKKQLCVEMEKTNKQTSKHVSVSVVLPFDDLQQKDGWDQRSSLVSLVGCRREGGSLPVADGV